MKPGWDLIGQAALQALPLPLRAFGANVQRMLFEGKKMFSNGLLIRDNMYAAAEVTLPLVHGVEYEFTNPLPTIPLYFEPYEFKLADGSQALPLAGPPILNKKLGNGKLGITVRYDGKHTEPFYEGSVTGQAIASGAGPVTAAGWTAAKNRGGVITESAGTFTVSEAGQYLVHAHEAGGVSLTRWLLRVRPAGVDKAREDMPGGYTTSAVNGQRSGAGAILDLAAGGTFTIGWLFTSATTPQNFDFSVQISRIYNATVDGYAANVTGVLWGG